MTLPNKNHEEVIFKDYHETHRISDTAIVVSILRSTYEFIMFCITTVFDSSFINFDELRMLQNGSYYRMRRHLVNRNLLFNFVMLMLILFFSLLLMKKNRNYLSYMYGCVWASYSTGYHSWAWLIANDTNSAQYFLTQISINLKKTSSKCHTMLRRMNVKQHNYHWPSESNEKHQLNFKLIEAPLSLQNLVHLQIMHLELEERKKILFNPTRYWKYIQRFRYLTIPI